METFQAIKNRRSYRSFLEKPVAEEVLKKLIDAGRFAPSANNLQPVEYIVITDKHMLESIALATDYGRFIMRAPVCIVVIAKNTKYYLEDGSAAVENILIAATAEGLGACWVAGDKKDYANDILKLLEVPHDYNLVALIPVGWPKQDRQTNEKKSISRVLHWEKF